ncbi:MAG: hypothetical protein IPJ94_10595 [Chloroflexi bacterium]|nr:hypothetical protein [Chloroflexota bacterium]
MVALRTGQPARDVLMQVYNPREQQYRLIVINAVPLFRDGETTPYQVYTIFDDITERRKAERALQDQVRLQNQIAQIASTVPGMICSFLLRSDGSMCMPYTSPALDEIYGPRRGGVGPRRRAPVCHYAPRRCAARPGNHQQIGPDNDSLAR